VVENYREAYDMFAVTGILFNHESPRRGETFVTRKITRAVAAIVAGQQDTLYLGNLDAIRDWGHARDYVEAMWLMLQQDEPRDYVIGMGESHSVREFCELAFGYVGLDWEPFVEVDPAYYRPTEVENLHADPSRAMAELGWKPKTTFRELVEEMVEADLGATACRSTRPAPGSRAASTRGSAVAEDVFDLDGARVWVAGHRGMVGSASCAGSPTSPSPTSSRRPRPRSTSPGRPRPRRSSPTPRPTSPSSPPPRSAGSTPTGPRRPSSSTTTS
jgi:hypothetical protein